MVPFCLHAVANTPAGLMEFIRSYDSISFGLPTNRGGSAPALSVSGPAQRSLTLRPARSPSRLATLCTRGFSSLVASTAALIATGWSEPVPGRVYPRCGPPPFHGAPGYPTYRPLERVAAGADSLSKYAWWFFANGSNPGRNLAQRETRVGSGNSCNGRKK